MENPEEILHSLEEFSKMKPKDIPRELEEYLCFVAKTGNPIYQWSTIKSLFREKIINVITEFYESCPSVDIPPCPNVEMFNYDMMKNFILEKLDTFAAAPFTVQRICELLTMPHKDYNRIDKYMRALEKNILVVSTTEPGRRSTENGDGIMNGLESEHLPESSNSSHDINIEEMDENPSNWTRHEQTTPVLFKNIENKESPKTDNEPSTASSPACFENEAENKSEILSSNNENPKQEPQETVITCTSTEEPFIPINTQESSSYQNLSEESNSNSSDSSSSITVSDTKDVPPEGKENVEPEVSEDKVDTNVPNEIQEEALKENLIIESKPDETPSLEETTESQPEEKQEVTNPPIEEVPPENTSESLGSTEVTSLSEITSEAEEKVEIKEKEAEPIVDKEEKIESEIKDTEEENASENVVDSSTGNESEEKVPLQDNEAKEAEVKDVVISDTNDIKESTEQVTTPMDVDSEENSQDKKNESEEPSSSVDNFVKMMSTYYPRE